METVQVSKSKFERLLEENKQLKRENELLKEGKMERLYQKILDMQEQIKKGERFTRADLKF